MALASGRNASQYFTSFREERERVRSLQDGVAVQGVMPERFTSLA